MIMELLEEVGKVHVSGSTYELIKKNTVAAIAGKSQPKAESKLMCIFYNIINEIT